MRKSIVFFLALFVTALCLSGIAAIAQDSGTEAVSAPAASSEAAKDFDFLRFAKEKVLPDFHPTAKIEEASSEYDKEPASTEDGITSARVRVFYKGWIRKHEMMSQIDLRPEAGLVKVTVLVDSNGSNLAGNKIFKENSWVELSSLNWK